MGSGIEEIYYDVDADVGTSGEPRLYARPTRIVTLAHPFTEDDLRAFAASGEHPGLD